MLNLPIGSDTPSTYLGGVGSSNWVCPPEFSFAPALREGFSFRSVSGSLLVGSPLPSRCDGDLTTVERSFPPRCFSVPFLAFLAIAEAFPAADFCFREERTASRSRSIRS